MKARWWILILAGAIVIAAWSAVLVGYLLHVDITTWTVLVTIGAFSLEGLLWAAAGVAGWSFLAGRRAALARLFSRREK